jgi:SAM-dependent methyltransferase
MSSRDSPTTVTIAPQENQRSDDDVPDGVAGQSGASVCAGAGPVPSGVALAGVAARYFRFVRQDILPLLPDSASCILDVGAGVGATSAWLRARYPGCRTVALEGNPALETELRANCDEVHIVDLNGRLPEVGAPDLVLLLDVLEHLADPWSVLRNITAVMAPHATVIVSVPNIAHLSVSLPLLLRGAFKYGDAGILDRTHLRFFVQDSALALLNGAGLQVRTGLLTGFDGRRTMLLDRLTLGRLRDRLAKQYILAGRRFDENAGQGPVRWRPVGPAAP